MGVLICCDEETQKQSKFDIARILIRTKYNLVLNETFNNGLNGEAFSIKIVEDSQGLLRIVMHKSKDGKVSESTDSSGSEVGDSVWDDEGDNSPRAEEPYISKIEERRMGTRSNDVLYGSAKNCRKGDFGGSGDKTVEANEVLFKSKILDRSQQVVNAA